MPLLIKSALKSCHAHPYPYGSLVLAWHKYISAFVFFCFFFVFISWPAESPRYSNRKTRSATHAHTNARKETFFKAKICSPGRCSHTLLWATKKKRAQFKQKEAKDARNSYETTSSCTFCVYPVLH